MLCSEILPVACRLKRNRGKWGELWQWRFLDDNNYIGYVTFHIVRKASGYFINLNFFNHF